MLHTYVLYYLHNTYKFNDILMATDDSDDKNKLRNKMNDKTAWLEFLLTEKIYMYESLS